MNRNRRVRRRRRFLVLGAAAAAVGLIAGILVASGTFDHALKELTLPLHHEDIIRQQAKEKEVDAALDSQTIENFRRTLACVAGRCILTGCDWQAVSRLAAAVPALRRGFDPCAEDTLEHLRDGIDCLDFVESALATAPEAEMIYLDYRIVLAAEEMGIDLVAPFRASGKAVDAWTLNTDHPGAGRSVKRLVALKVDQITSDEPDALQALYESSRREAPPAFALLPLWEKDTKA